MPRKRKRVVLPCLKAAKAWLKASDKGAYYNRAASPDTEEESGRPGGPSEISTGPNTDSRSYSQVQQHLDSSTMSASDESEWCSVNRIPDGNQIWDCEQLQDTTDEAAVCRYCKKSILQLRTRKSRGWTIEVTPVCTDLECQTPSMKSAVWQYTPKSLDFGVHVVNRALNFSALMLSAMLNLPKPLHRANWADYTRQLCSTVSGVAKEVFREATLRAKLLHLKQGHWRRKARSKSKSQTAVRNHYRPAHFHWWFLEESVPVSS